MVQQLRAPASMIGRRVSQPLNFSKAPLRASSWARRYELATLPPPRFCPPSIPATALPRLNACHLDVCPPSQRLPSPRSLTKRSF